MSDSSIHFKLAAEDITAPNDHGLFGPYSVTWKVWSHPAAFVGLTRSFYIEVLGSIDAAAALADRGTYKSDPVGRLSRTMSYFLTVIFGDTEAVTKANLRLFKMHSHIKGNIPLTGKRYSAQDPLLMAGTYLITWHSVYYAYEKLVGKLSKEEEDRYFKEGLRYFKSLQEFHPDLTIEAIKESAKNHSYDISGLEDIVDIPATRTEYKRFLQLTNQGSAITQQTREIINTLLMPSVETDDMAMNFILKFYPVLNLTVISLLPKEICNLVGLPRSVLKDKMAIAAGKIFVNSMSIPRIRKVFESRIGTAGYSMMHIAIQS